MENRITNFVKSVSQQIPFEAVFNPWRDVDRENDISEKAPEIRRDQLAHYFNSRLRSARFLIIGEALGYQGGHFSGIAMTSERILLGHQIDREIHPADVLPDLKPQRTSKPEIMPNGFNEPTATIVWGLISNSGSNPLEFVLWNSFPWHPYHAGKGILSNRKPKSKEMDYASGLLNDFVELYPGRPIFAMGRVASASLDKMGIENYPVRHPAQGGARKFRNQMQDYLSKF